MAEAANSREGHRLLHFEERLVDFGACCLVDLLGLGCVLVLQEVVIGGDPIDELVFGL